ncbi:NlpC/P60 family protein [Tsuneonella sp. SYSU-LHT278]|uniref:NlpC/P60 family protein n=1 Tax=Tsuneonella sediminis TaxID=3416089 RepID=UPI003F79E69B
MTRAVSGARLAAAAEALAGTPFRLHGRDPASGLDCVGVVAAAFAACGHSPPKLCGYGLRNTAIHRWTDLASLVGLVDAAGGAKPGDVILVRPGAGQHHLLLALDRDRFVHAHAGLRRVVIQPGPLPWPVERRWRIAEEE